MTSELSEAILWLRRSRDANPDLGSNYSALAAAYGVEGCLEEANAALSEYERLHPGMTISKLRAWPFSTHPAFLAWREHFFDGLRKAGMPEE